ncbi:uncharacterized protein B0H18DRAFT_1003605 [Fomitopsis serialis]|uniref:uncharacterized protein n=1 Tax=Fomitopsis serialis TaxID=139415 RepID=UPI002007D2A4|nr:uncharacterized protein B0H18DRAFT_1003605 [Neoantrodia serialis]KAH9927230.1 hypothetical protein B0H18DRAFT_1003605 [Neoantrodia serialis]
MARINFNVLESLPVELIADVLGELDLSSLVTTTYEYDPALRHLSVRSTVPRNNFVEILSIARANYLLFEASLPHLKDSEWEECFRRRFLPSWAKIKKKARLSRHVLVLYRVWHRTSSTCTHDEAWTDYIVLNRNGTTNQLNGTSRGFDPLTIFEQMSCRCRILAIGVLSKPRTSFGVNHLAKALLHPPGIDGDAATKPCHYLPLRTGAYSGARASETYRRLSHPLPAPSYENYPFFTPSGEDLRWYIDGDIEEGGMQWMWSMMLIAQLIGQNTKPPFGDPSLLDLELVDGMSRSHYASLTFEDLKTIAPWIEPMKWIEGIGLGHEE